MAATMATPRALANLTHLELGDNTLCGNLESLGSLVALEILMLRNNCLFGTLDPIGQLVPMIMHHVSHPRGNHRHNRT